MDPNFGLLIYRLVGPDASSFAIGHTTGQISTRTVLDHETKSRYRVSVIAADTSLATTRIAVTITVNNLDEPGTIALSSDMPQAGTPITATLEDPDGLSTQVAWTWERSSFGILWTVIDGATSLTYTPVAADEQKFLRVAASYRDQQSSDTKTATGTTNIPVAPEPQFTLSVVPSQIREGRSFTASVSSRTGDPFLIDQVVSLYFTGTAVQGIDYAVEEVDYIVTPLSITIPVGETSGEAVITALTDNTSEPSETIIIEARHDNQTIGAVTVTILGGGTGGAGGGGGGAGGGGGFDEGGGDELPPTASELFEDIDPGVWYEQAVSWMILHKVTSGCATTMFCPDDNLTRQQFVTFLWRAAGRPTARYLGSEAFTDVTPGGYAEQSIGWAAANGITAGCTPGTFGDPDWQFCPTQPVTRGQMATLLYRHVEADYQGAAPSYTDVEPDRFYATSITWLTDFQVVPGCDSTRFCPNRDATRAEGALFINGVAIRPHIWGPGNTSFIPQPN